MAQPQYRRRQQPIWFLLLILFLTAVTVAVVLFKGLHVSVWIVAGFAVVLATLFFGLSVAVTDQAVHLSFGVGIIRKTIDRSSVVSARAVRNSWWYGFGIRLTPHGWMWNISGLDAVEIQFGDGKRFRIGTADPDGLLAALGFGDKTPQD